MKKFTVRLVQFLIIPGILAIFIIFLYIKRDPYMDFGHHRNYSWKYNFQQLGDIATKKLTSSQEPYNSFIFGSSRTVAFYACYLQKKIAESRFFHYANWNETIGGIYAKINLLDSLGYSIDNVLICFDSDYTFADDGKCRTYDHYLLTHMNRCKYYYGHFKSMIISLEKSKLKILLGRKVSGEVFPDWESDIITNDPQHICSASIIANYGSVDFGEEHLKKINTLRQTGVIYVRSSDQQYIEDQISSYEEDLLVKIKEIFDKHNTNYYVIINPLYDQRKFSADDNQIFKNVFNHRIYDFSGINEYTNNENNYPDGKHFMPYIAKAIIDSIIVTSN